MDGWKSAFAAVVATVALAGCGGDDEPPPFKTVSQPTNTSTVGPTTTPEIESKPRVYEMLSNLGSSTRAKLAPLAQAWAGLDNREEDVVHASEDVQRIVEQLATGNAAPGGSAPELAKLSEALGSFGEALRPIAETMLPQLSRELQARARQLDRSRPTTAAKLLTAQAQVDSVIGV